MKKLFTALVLVFPLLFFAQAPQGLNYQAIAWDNNNLPKQNKTLTVIFSILNGSATGPDEFYEIQTVTTNAQGLFTTTIGIKNSELFKKINWSTGTKFLKVNIDGVEMGTTQILSVPYAMYAERTNLQAGEGIAVSGNTISNTGDKDNTNEIQELGINGNQLSLSKSNKSVNLPTQQLSLSGNQLSLSNGGGSVNLPKLVSSYGKLEDRLAIPTGGGDFTLNSQITVPEDGFYLVLISYDIILIYFGQGGVPKATVYFQDNQIQEHSSTTGAKEVRYFDQLNLVQGGAKISVSTTGFGSISILNVKVYIQKIN